MVQRQGGWAMEGQGTGAEAGEVQGRAGGSPPAPSMSPRAQQMPGHAAAGRQKDKQAGR